MTAPPEDFSAAEWCLVVPIKRLKNAKSRLAGTAAAHRERLALAFAGDTVAAAIQCRIVATVLVVTDDPRAREMALALGADVVPDRPDAGLNPALRWGAETARERQPELSIGALSADLPALRPGELEIALRFAATAGREGRPAVVADSHGRGTTAYLTTNGVAFDPAFGTDSLAAHLRAGALAVPADGIATLRLDVDTVGDLAVAAALGVGERTAAVLADVELP